MNLSPARRVGLLGVLISLSGGCALVYQMVWLREFRLIFGAATPATAAVLAVFMAGLGAGSAWFGRRAERTARPLRLYAGLELALSLAALLTPWVLQLVRALYIRTGGVVVLGSTGAALIHILLAFVVLFGPCALMGGTLPLAVKWIETDEDGQRGSAGLLYGLNALGALAGVVGSTFWLLEALGTRGTLYLVVVVNAGLGAVALWVARREQPGVIAPATERTRSTTPAAAPAGYVCGAAFVTGFVFFLAELVWYRMSAPLLGSSTYNFGVILAVALAGIGLGGVLFRVWLAPRPGAVSLGGFGLVSALQAGLLFLPFALGDRVAVLAYYCNQLRSFSFGGQVAGWTVIAVLLVLGPSILAGLQFPLLVSLLGCGRADVGRHLGLAYAWNTAGAITGSLLGGFVLLPGLTAPGCWKLVTWLTLALSASALVLGRRRASRPTLGLGAAVAAVTLCLSVTVLGPTGVWRHSAIGYGRASAPPTSPNTLRDWMNLGRWQIRHEIEGRESSLAINALDGYAFLVNGKADGSGASSDAATQIMLGLLGAMLHPQPRTACVIGLGTGSTAGWLADVPGMERVDVVEIEPGIRELARDYFGPVNRDVMRKPNVRIIPGDAREVLLVRGPSYDLIASEPSNPYRAGIASLYTREYYEAVRDRLGPDGIFSQWVQGYEIDAATVRLIYATLASVFPHVETWITSPKDLLFVCHREAPSYPLARLRQRAGQAPFAEALRRVWLTDSAEGVLAHHLATPEVAREIAAQEGRPSTDNNNLLEYHFVRALVQAEPFDTGEILQFAALRGADQPRHLRSQLDPVRMQRERLLVLAASLSPISVPADLPDDLKRSAEVVAAYAVGDSEQVLRSWRGDPDSVMVQMILLEALAQSGQPDQARGLIERVRENWPLEARFAAAQLAANHGAVPAALEHLKVAFALYRTDPWVRSRVAKRGLVLAVELAKQSPETAAEFFELFAKPFCMAANDAGRLVALVDLSRKLSPAHQVRAADAWGAFQPWTRTHLEFRRNALVAVLDPRRQAAQADLDTFMALAGRSFLESAGEGPPPR